MSTETQIFDPGRIRLQKGISLVEASAGTGKTYAIAMLALRAVAELGVTVDKLLIVTFTKAATEELRARIRTRLAQARDLLQGKSTDPDPTLAGWAAGLDNRDLVSARLQSALYDIDQVSIFTIHSFCRKMLQEQALESGQLFDAELLADIDDIRSQVVDDFWRSHVYGLAPRPCSMITDVFPTPESLAASIRGSGAAAVIEPNAEEFSSALAGSESSFAALASWWQGKAAGLFSHFEQAVAEQKFKKDFCQSFSSWWQALDAFFRQESQEQPADLQLLTRQGLLSVLNGQKLRGEQKKEDFITSLPLPENEAAIFLRAAKALVLSLRSGLATTLKNEVERRLTRHGTMSFDDLILRLSRAIGEGGMLQGLLSRRYLVALIDEFQDTDALQWHIFHSLFGAGDHYFYLIGDPKQAIYKFRGADIFSYFQAKKAATARLTLDRNYRSHPDLVGEVNRLFTGRPEPFSFPEDLMGYQRVIPARGLEDGYLQQEGEPFAAMIYGQLPETEKGAWTSGKASLNIRRFIVSEIIGLLDHEKPVHIVSKEKETRPLKPRDIAVLVRSNTQAEEYRRAFSEVRVPAVVTSRASVFQTDACSEMFLLLEAVAEPGDMHKLKRAMTISWFGITGDELQRIWQDEAEVDDWHGRFQNYSRIWQEQGFLTMMNRLVINEEVLVTLASGKSAQRNIANIHHLSELIQTAESSENLGCGGTLKWLRTRMKALQMAEDVELRLESDEEAVKIVTMHSAKGLEYPVVFCPYLWYRSIRLQKERWAISCHDTDQRLVLDLGSERFEERREQAVAEEFAEDLRIAYVALTRAKLCCYVFWADVKGSAATTDSFSSALGYLLFPRGRVDFKTQERTLQARAAVPSIGYRILADDGMQAIESFRGTQENPVLSPLLPSGRNLSTDWQMSSYSALASLSDNDAQDHMLAVPESDGSEPALYPGLPAGTGFGNLVHALLEQVPFSSFAAGDDCSDIQIQQCGRFGVQVAQEVLQRLLAAVVTTPLTDDPAFTLAGLDAGCLVKEMPFYFHPDRIATSEINAVLANEPTVVPLTRKVMQGFLTGFVDLFFAYKGKFYLADYKTNYLGDATGDYLDQNLVRAMAAHNYGLQYWIYTLVLDRHLQNVLPDYDYKRHFGGVFYLFVRGMVPGRPESGVYFALPDREVLDRLKSCVEGR